MDKMMRDAVGKIPVGRENAISAYNLAIRLGCNDRRLRNIVNAARREGVPVCSENGGYFIPATREEAARCIGRLKTHGAEEILMARAIEKAVSGLDGQTKIDGGILC